MMNLKKNRLVNLCALFAGPFRNYLSHDQCHAQGIQHFSAVIKLSSYSTRLYILIQPPLIPSQFSSMSQLLCVENYK